MKRPIQKGDLCEIIEGALGNKGPNIGKQVTVGQMMGEHTEFGNIWEVYGNGLVTEFGAIGNTTQCAQAWLRRIDPPKTLNSKHLEQELKV